MNRDALKKNIGTKVRLQPAALNATGLAADDDWLVRNVRADAVELQNVTSGSVAVLGLDHVYSFLTDPGRSQGSDRYGFLQLLVQVSIGASAVDVKPLPPPRTGSGMDASTARLQLLHDAERTVADALRDYDEHRHKRKDEGPLGHRMTKMAAGERLLAAIERVADMILEHGTAARDDYRALYSDPVKKAVQGDIERPYDSHRTFQRTKELHDLWSMPAKPGATGQS